MRAIPSRALFAATLLILLVLSLLALDSALAGEAVYLCRFEDEEADKGYKAAKSDTTVEEGSSGTGHHLRWDIEENEEWFALYVDLDLDILPYSALAMRIKADREIPRSEIVVRVRSDREDFLSFTLPPVTTRWTTIALPFVAFRTTGKPDPKTIKTLAFVGWRSKKAMSICIDDIHLIEDPKGWQGALKEKMDFENPVQTSCVYAGASSVESATEDGNRYLVWRMKKGMRAAWVDLSLVPRDLRRYGEVRFRIKADRAIKSETFGVRLYDKKGNFLGTYLKAIPKGWSTVAVPLGFMWTSGAFDPTKIEYLEFIGFGPPDCCLGLDDIELVPGEKGENSWRCRPDPKIEFNDPRRLYTVFSGGSTLGLKKAGRKKKTLEWTISSAQDWVRLMFLNLPPDIRGFGCLRFTMRASRRVADSEFYLKLSSSHQDYLYAPLPALGPRWQRLDLRLPAFKPHKSIDPTKIRNLRIVGWNVKPVTIHIKSLEFVKGRRKNDSWRPTEREKLALIFGADRVRKVKTLEAGNLILLTDTKAAQGGLFKSLAGNLEFVCKTLGLPSLKKKLPIYIFRNEKAYSDFCQRYCGFSRKEAEHTAGHGCSRYFATFYTQPNDPVVVHELTHSVVHRSLGSYGGSWFHEGFAVYVEMKFQKQNPASEFAVNLKNGNFTPLREFVGIRTLAFVESKRDANKAARLYQQAGAFFAFLKEGPLSGRYGELVKTLTKNHTEPEDRPKILEKILGLSLEDVEKRWIKWGSKRRK